jgi:putative hydroxymethylpyrimidine transport system permease protein
MMAPAAAARASVIAAGLIVLWQVIVLATGVPHYILPGPRAVFLALADNAWLLLFHAGTTAAEIVLGLVLGAVLGAASALVMDYARGVRRWLMPVLVVSQAVPVFALAPLLVLWLGYGMASKVAMATLIIYFPVTASFLDGLRRTEPGWLDLAGVMGASRLAVLRRIRVPAALPAFASGMRVATAVAPIGAVVGEWVGSSGGLGYQMLQANARMQTDLMFAALVVLALLAITLYFIVDRILVRALPWLPDTGADDPTFTEARRPPL